MAIEIAVVNSTTPTSTGTQSYESTGFGTPQAAIIILTRANTTNNPEAHAQIGVGFTDGTNSRAHSANAFDNFGTSDTYRHASQGYCLLLVGYGSIVASASFSAWSINGVTLNFDAVHTEPLNVTVVLVKGCTNAHVGSAQLSTTGVNDITTVGFKGNLGILTCIGYTSNNTGTSAGMLSFGAWHNNSSDTVSQGQVAWGSLDASADDKTTTITRSDSCVGQLYNDAQGWKGSVQDVDTSGFSVNTSTDSPGNDYINYLILDTGDTDGVSIDIVDSPTATGTWDVTAPGFTPQAVILGMTATTTTNTMKTDDPAYFGIGAFDDTTESCAAISFDDAAATTDTQSNYGSANAVQVYNADGGQALSAEGAFSSFDSSGYNLSFPTTVDSTARKWLSIAVKAASGVVSGNATATATATGDLTTQIPITGAALSVATASGSLTTGIALQGQASAVVNADGALTASIKFEAAALAQVTATGALTTQISLSGAAVAQVLASATLTTGGGLEGNAQAVATVSGAIITAIPLAGTAQAYASGSGNLSTIIQLAGAAAAVNSATGELTTSFTFAGDAVAVATAAGTLTTSITLNGAALAQALATANLTVTSAHQVSATRTRKLIAENRTKLKIEERRERQVWH